jgi:hypothetical protein
MSPHVAKLILAEAGEVWLDKEDLSRIKYRTFDGVIKRACDCLIEEERRVKDA